MTPILEPHNAVFLRFCHEPNLSKARLLGVKRAGLGDLWGGCASQALGKVGRLVPTPEPHNSVCPRFYPNLGNLELPGVGSMGCARSLESGASRSSKGRGTTQVYGKVAWIVLTPTLYISVSDASWVSQVSTCWPRQLTIRHGASFAGWGERESRGWSYCFPPVWCFSTQERCHLWCWHWLSTGILAAVSSAVSLEWQFLHSLHCL